MIASSKATVDAYRPSPSSFAIFDINAIEEPWRMDDSALQQQQQQQQQQQIKSQHVPAPILEKLNKFESDAPEPHSWDEVSKALEDLKPTLQSPTPPPPNPNPNPNPNPVNTSPPTQDSHAPKIRRKSFSFHTLEELESKLTPKPNELRKTESMRSELKKSDSVKTELKKKIDSVKPESRAGFAPTTESEGYKRVKENIFVLRDRQEREREGSAPSVNKWNPLIDFPEKCPPGGSDSMVLYTTSLGGVRRTYEDCNRVRSLLETHRVVFDERDVSLHGEFRSELRDMLGEGVSVPRLFVKGRYVGGVEEVVGLNETGRLGRIMNWARVERGVGRQACEGCGGGRFVPCLDCGGSCKVLIGDKKEKERCPKCNENGLVHCPTCL